MTPPPTLSLPKFSMFFQPEPSSSTRASGGSREPSYHHHESGASSSSSTTSSPEHQGRAATRQFASTSAYGSSRHLRRPLRGADHSEYEAATGRSRTPSFGGMNVASSPTMASAGKMDLASAAMPPPAAAAHHRQGTAAGMAQGVAENHRSKRAQREDSDPHVASPPPEPVQRERISRYLSEGDRRNIISRIDKGEKQVSLAKEYGVSRAAICNLYKNRKVVLTRVDRDPDAKHPKKQKHSMAADASSPNLDPVLRRDSEDSMHEVVLNSQQQLQQMQLARERYHEEVQQQQQEMQRHHLRHQQQQQQQHQQRQHEAAVASRRKQQPFRVHEASSYSYPIQHLLSALRDATTPPQSFRHNANRLMRLLIEDALTCLPVQPKELKTTLGDSCAGVHAMPQHAVCAISMEANSGSVLLRAFSDIYPDSPAGMVSLDTQVVDASGTSAAAWTIRAQFPRIDPSRQVVMLLDTHCATGERAVAVLRHLIQELGVPPSSIYFVSVIASTAGLHRIYDLFPDVVLITAKMDAMVDANRDIRPGIGHFIERYWNLH